AELEKKPGGLAVLGHVGDARGDGIRRTARRKGFSLELNRSRLPAIRAEDHSGQFGSSRADQAGESDNLPGVHLEVDALHAFSVAHTAAPEHGTPSRGRGLLPVKFQKGTSHHPPDDEVAIESVAT